MKKLWARLGIQLEISDDEAKILMNGISYEGRGIIERIIKENRFRMEGETYIPEVSVEEYNERYGTNFEVENYEFEMHEEE